MGEIDTRQREEARKRRSGLIFNRPKGEDEMGDKHTSKGQGNGPIPQHKRLAEGQKVTGMKKGGKVEKECEGGKMKKGGIAKKKGK